MVPLGLAVLAQDVPVMRPPLARLLREGQRQAKVAIIIPVVPDP